MRAAQADTAVTRDTWRHRTRETRDTYRDTLELDMVSMQAGIRADPMVSTVYCVMYNVYCNGTASVAWYCHYNNSPTPHCWLARPGTAPATTSHNGCRRMQAASVPSPAPIARCTAATCSSAAATTHFQIKCLFP